MSTHLLVIGAWHHEHKKYFDKKKKQTGHLHQILTAQQKEHIYTNLSRSVVYSVSYLHFTQDVDFNENMLMHRSISSSQSSSFRCVPTWCCSKHISHVMHTSSANLPRHFLFSATIVISIIIPKPKEKKRHTNRISTQTQTSFAKIIKWSYC